MSLCPEPGCGQPAGTRCTYALCPGNSLSNSARREITPEMARELLEYDPASGALKWKRRDSSLFADTTFGGREGLAKAWNKMWAGKPAFRKIDKDGYLAGKIFAKSYQAHRVAWAVYYGEWPDGQIDHINHDPTDNRLENLRVVSPVGNGRNKRLPSNNKSGTPGVSWDEKLQRWRCYIGVGHKNVYVGRFKTKEAAVEARKLAEHRFGFHPNHGSRAGADLPLSSPVGPNSLFASSSHAEGFTA